MTHPATRHLRLIAVLLAAALAATGGARAQSLNITAGGGSGEPIEVHAQNGIEWIQDRQIFLARGNARAVRGEVEVLADLLRAYYRERGGSTEVWRLDAEGSVKIHSPSEAVYGELAIYDVDKSILVVRGGDLRFEAGSDVIRADRQLEYWETRKMAVARGNAVAVRDDKTLRADVLAAYFRRQSDGSTRVFRVDAFDDVTIVTAKDTVTADRGVYNVESGIATLAGSVTIKRGENVLTGCSAEVNLNTGVSRLFSCDQNTGQRVEGLIQPGSQDDQ